MPFDLKKILIFVFTVAISVCCGWFSFAQTGNQMPRELQAIAEKFQTPSGSTPYQNMISDSENIRNRSTRKKNEFGNIQLVSGNEPVDDYEIDKSRHLSQGGDNPLRKRDHGLSFVQPPNDVSPQPFDESELEKSTRPIHTNRYADDHSDETTVTRQVAVPNRAHPSGSGLTKITQTPKTSRANQMGTVRRAAVGSDDSVDEDREYNQLVDMIESYEAEEAGKNQEEYVTESQTSPALPTSEQTDSSYMEKLLPPPKERSESDKKISFTPGSQVMSVVSVLGSLCLVLGVFFMFVLFMKKIGPKSGGNLPKEAFENVGRYPLSPKLQLNLLRLGNRLMLVASTPDGGVETLTEIDHPDEVVQILGMCRRLDPNSSSSQFQSVLDEFAKEKTPVEPPQTLSSLLSSGSLYG